MRIGIGLGLGPDAAGAAASAVRDAKRTVPKPDLAMVFGSIHLDQKQIHRALCSELDPEILLGGSSYAEITSAGVTKRSVAALLLSFDDVPIRIRQTPFREDTARMGRDLGRAFRRPPGGRGRLPVGLMVSSYFGSMKGSQNGFLRSFGDTLGSMPIFGGVAGGDYDLGMSHRDFWINYEYAGRSLAKDVTRVAVLDFPASEYRLGFGFEHGCLPVGPVVELTRCKGNWVYEVGGVPIFDYYRQFLGRESSRGFFELMVQRFGFSLSADDGSQRTFLKLPVDCDFKRRRIAFIPMDDLQGRKVQLTLGSRKALVRGASEAAQRCRESLGGRKPALVLVVSCCTRNSILHSRIETEVDAVRAVFGREVPVFGFYSGGEIAPFLSRYQDIVDSGRSFAGSHFHACTVCIFAIAPKKPVKVAGVPTAADGGAAAPAGENARLLDLLDKSEATLDNAESFLANLSRKSYRDGERLRRQNEIIHRYTPHEVWKEIGASVARGRYELSDARFDGCFLFMDVKGYTSYSEEHSPKEVVAALNGIFGPATETIYRRGGDVDKYIGDCIFAAFKDPKAAVAAGREILLLVEEHRRRGSPFMVRVGIHGGKAVRANVGSKDRREYTYIGDAVNLTQRLESNCTPGRLLISETVYRRAGARFSKAQRREITVKGKKRPVVAYECSP